MTSKDISAELLENSGIKVTANRIIVLDALLRSPGPMSAKEIENEVSTLDKSSIFRCLMVMKESGLLHTLDGGPEGVRYEVCRAPHDGPDTDEHLHFHCEVCGRTFCFEDIGIPAVTLPSGYEIRSTELTVKGVCRECAGKRRG
ncbi:MAG: transcriptional repressor [Bacteroidales bacterium]|nr:transcriptional repressor [Bacteroidales bacterium]